MRLQSGYVTTSIKDEAPTITLKNNLKIPKPAPRMKKAPAPKRAKSEKSGKQPAGAAKPMLQ
uniref:Uncharacterized protein n=1 Tax=Romanomermis culicivorax TaxID=13658 RepID=A0A915IS24_ROMCU